MTRALTPQRPPRSVPFARADIVPAAQQAALQALAIGLDHHGAADQLSSSANLPATWAPAMS